MLTFNAELRNIRSQESPEKDQLIPETKDNNHIQWFCNFADKSEPLVTGSHCIRRGMTSLHSVFITWNKPGNKILCQCWDMVINLPGSPRRQFLRQWKPFLTCFPFSLLSWFSDQVQELLSFHSVTPLPWSSYHSIL